MTDADGLSALFQMVGELTTTVIVLALLFAERKSHNETRVQLEEARKEHLADLRQIAYMQRQAAAPLVDQHPYRNERPPV